MTPTPWRKKLGQGTRALAQLFRKDELSERVPVQPEASGEPDAPPTDPYRVRIAAGEDPASAALALARDHIEERRPNDAVRLGYELLRDPASADIGHAVLGVAHLSTATPAQAWAEFVQLQDVAVRGLSCPEYAIAGFGADPDACAALCRDLVVAHPGTINGYAALVIARHAFSVAHETLARDISAAAAAGRFGTLTEYWASEFTRLQSWFTDGFRRAPQQLLDADLRFGVLDYKQPDNASRNVGDYIQTLASLGHLVRQRHLRFVGEPELVAAVDDLRHTVKPERQRDDAAASVQLIEVQRDGNVYQSLPEPTWAVMFGWYLHPTFSGGYNLPFHPHLRPLFISFHLNKPDALTPAATNYLRRYGPIGCRDWQTVALLAAAGVPAFFSGCITTTVDTVFARTGPDERTGVVHIDAQSEPEEGEQIEQSVDDLRAQPLPVNLALGRQWVERYATEFAEVSTSRLHSYLPARSVGCRVDFHPGNPSDPRFGGLIGIDDHAYELIRQGILDKLAGMLATLADGADEQQAYGRWRELCAPDVAAAQEFLAGLEFGRRELPEVTLPALGERVIVVNAPRSSKTLKRLLKSLRGQAPDEDVLVVGAEPEGLWEGSHHIPAPAGQDLTMAAVLAALPDHCRALVLTSDAVLRDAPNALFAAATGGDVLAADPDLRRNRQSLSVLIRRVSARQGADWQRALQFAATAHRRCGHGGIVPDTRVCVIDPVALRASGWSELAGELIGTFSARLSEALAVAIRGVFADLPAHAQTRLGVEPYDPEAVVLQGAGAARVPLKWLAGARTGSPSGGIPRRRRDRLVSGP